MADYYWPGLALVLRIKYDVCTGSGGVDVGSVEYWMMIKLPLGQSARLHQVQRSFTLPHTHYVTVYKYIL